MSHTCLKTALTFVLGPERGLEILTTVCGSLCHGQLREPFGKASDSLSHVFMMPSNRPSVKWLRRSTSGVLRWAHALERAYCGSDRPGICIFALVYNGLV